MSFRLIFLLLTLVVFQTGCTEKTIPQPNNPTPESRVDATEKETADPSELWSNSFDKITIEISRKIQSGQEDQLWLAWEFIRVRLFSASAMDNDNYLKSRTQKLVGLYADLLEKVEKGDFSLKLTSATLAGLDEFDNYYVAQCVSDTPSACVRIRAVLQNDSKSIGLVLRVARTKIDPLKKLAILGFAFDMSRGNGLRHPQLEKDYTDLLVHLVFEKEEDFEGLPFLKKMQHYRNLEFLFKMKNWQAPSDEELAILRVVKPWLLDSTDSNFVRNLRELLVKDIFVYINKLPEISEDLIGILRQSLEKIEAGKAKLKGYPAYSDIDIRALEKNSPLISLIVIGVYYRDIGVPLANEIYNNAPNKGFFLKEFWEKSRLLIRWDMAQLGIESTEFLSGLLKDQPNKTAEFIQTVLDTSQELNQPWNLFHNQRSANIYNFLDANRDDTPMVRGMDVDDFFQSFDRNIMKTVIYPNMFAFILEMSETQWNGTLNFRLKWGFNVRSNQLFDTMVNGGFYFPWFSFVNLSGKWTYSENTRNSLFRSEILDAYYYFITTKTYKSYQIDLDFFFKRMAENLLKDRKEAFESVLTAQNRTYFADDSDAQEFLRWCAAIDKGEKFDELIHYYKLKDRITPYSDPLKSINGSKISLNSRLDFYFFDQYTGVGNLLAADVEEMNDQFRMVFVPILNYLEKIKSLTEKVADRYPELGIAKLEKAQETVSYLNRMKKAYLGSQVELAKQFQNCRFTAAEESKRRIQQVAFLEKVYLEEVVYPTLMKLKKGEISRLKARITLDAFHKFSPAFRDTITMDENGNPTLVYTYSSFSKRTALYLTEGIQYEKFDLKLSEEPIVGSQLVIEEPSNLGDDVYRNPYVSFRSPEQSRRMFYFSGNKSKEEFSKSVLANVMDSQRGKASQDKLTAWDVNDTHPYIQGVSANMEYYATFIQMGEFDHYDYSKPECRKYKQVTRPAGCNTKTKYEFSDLTRIMGRYYDVIELDDTDFAYMELIGEDGYYAYEYMDTLAYYDKALLEKPAIYHRDGRFFHRELNGFMDLAYLLFNEDYLGDFYKTHFYSTTNAGEAATQCSNYYRNNCRWGWEKNRAEDFYQARSKRQKIFMYKFDPEILAESYRTIRDDVVRKLSYANFIKENAQKYLDEYRRGRSTELITSPLREPYELLALRSNLRESKDELQFFLDSDTGGFYKKEPEWLIEYLKWAPADSPTSPESP